MLAEVSAVGLHLGLAVALGYWVGSWLDRRYHTEPWFMMALVVAGVISGIREAYRVSRKWTSDDDQPPSQS